MCMHVLDEVAAPLKWIVFSERLPLNASSSACAGHGSDMLISKCTSSSGGEWPSPSKK